jgi:predicted phosphodiesterase
VDELLSKRFALISNPTEELPNPEPYIIPKQYKNTLIIADLHSKFYDRRATEIAINYGVKKGCDSVIIDGDFMDYYGFSKFDRSAITMNGFEDEREWGVDMLQLLQECFGRVFLKKGNHDIRRELSHERLAVQFPDVLDLARYSEYLFFDDSNVEIIEDYRHIVYGKANIIHGHEYQGGGGIHVAYNRLSKTMDNTISAHSHITQSDFRPDINGNLYGSWSIGCLCNLHPRYNPKNRWTQGFARIEKDESGEFEMLNRMIYNGKTIPV